LRSGLLHGRGGHRIAVGVVAWPRFVLWALSSHGRGGCRIAVGVVAWPRFVSRALLLRGRRGRRVTWLRWALCHVAVVGVASCCRGGCHHAAFCVAGAVVAWPRWVSSCRVVSRSGLLRCMVAVGVIAPRGTVVIGPQKRKLAEKREKKKRKTHQRVHRCE
jgi:hypothetical protein